MNMLNENKTKMMILGSTGSVGEQAVDVAKMMGVKVDAISAHKNVKRAEEQARFFGVKACAMSDEDAARDLKEKLSQPQELSGILNWCLSGLFLRKIPPCISHQFLIRINSQLN